MLSQVSVNHSIYKAVGISGTRHRGRGMSRGWVGMSRGWVGMSRGWVCLEGWVCPGGWLCQWGGYNQRFGIHPTDIGLQEGDEYPTRTVKPGDTVGK